MVRAGEEAFLINDFMDLNIVAIGWETGDLSGKSFDEIKQIMKDKYSDANNRSLGINIGQVTKFVLDFQIGDYVISSNPNSRKYLVGKVISDYYYSDKLAKKYDFSDAYCHFRDVEWLGETNWGDLSSNSLNSLNSVITVFNIKDSAKNEVLIKLNNDKIEWTDFYMEFADKLLEYKNDRPTLISKIQNIYNILNMELPTLEADKDGNILTPSDIDSFTVFALFNKQISSENRINLVNQIKKEFSLKNNAPMTFHGVSLVNNLKATFYGFEYHRGEYDIDNLWDLFNLAVNFSDDNREEFISVFDQILSQRGIKWNITMALNWIRPFTFINLDSNNRDLLSSDEIFSEEFKNEIKSLKEPPSGEKYLLICEECKSGIEKTEKYSNFPEFSHVAYLSMLNENDDGSDEGIGDNDVNTTSYWLISAGSGSKWWDEFYNKGVVGLGMKGTGDLSKYQSKNEIKLKLQEIYNDNSSHVNDVHACWQFVHEMKIGDVIFVKKGWNEIIGRGIVESDYEYDTTKSFHNVRKVKWTHNGSWLYENTRTFPYKTSRLPTKTLTDITNYSEMVDYIIGLIGGIGPEPPVPPYDIEKFLDEVYITEDNYNTLVNLLKHKKNLIVQGAPGVGKTFMAKRLAYSMMGKKNINRVMMVQFHQSYSYEDFVMGYRPSNEGFELRQGSFYQFCKKAEEDSENDYFFIIDEINRGHLSKIFGELFMLIEADKRGDRNKIQLLYSDEKFFIPDNIYIIGLMNTADRSLAMIDYALRRRFAFFDLKPGFDSAGFKDYQDKLNDSRFNNLVLALKQLNEEIKNDESLGEGFRIGHSYLCNLKDCEKLDFIVEYELIPLLKEYWFDEQDKVRYWSDKLRSVIND